MQNLLNYFKKSNINNIDLAEQLFNTQILGNNINPKYNDKINTILDECILQGEQYPDRQAVLLKVIQLIGEPQTAKERYLVAKFYAWSKVQYREKAIHYLELYLNNNLYTEAYIHNFRNINDTPEIRKLYHLDEMYCYLAKAYEGTYQLDKALNIYEYLISIFPGDPTAYTGKTNILIKQNKLNQCSEWLKNVKKLPYYKLNKKYAVTAPENWFYFTINKLLNDIEEKIEKKYVYKTRHNTKDK